MLHNARFMSHPESVEAIAGRNTKSGVSIFGGETLFLVLTGHFGR